MEKIKFFITNKSKHDYEKKCLGHVADKILSNTLSCVNREKVMSLGDRLYLQKEDKKGGYRLCWFLRNKTIDDVEYKIFVFREMYKHDEYDRSLDETNISKWVNAHNLTEAEEEELEQEFVKMSTDECVCEAPKKELNDCESGFIYDTNTTSHSLFDETICETREWINMVQDENFHDFDAVANPLESLIYDNCNSTEQGPFYVPLELKEEKTVVVYCHRGTPNKWILQKIINTSDVSKNTEVVSTEDLLRDCRRAYPYTFLESRDLWRIMEQDPNSNFILSEEEVDIVSKNNEYPLFISGRAGSGKSTVLQYLFADTMLKYLQYRKDDQLLPPIYLSYSDNLVANAKKLSSSLFKDNHVYNEKLKKAEIDFEKDLNPHIDIFFSVFQKLIMQCIQENDSEVIKKKFSPEKYVSFSTFRNLWIQKFGKDPDALKYYGPSISWHIIRTYIKGWNSEYKLDPNDYKTIGQKNQDVTFDTFNIVYEKVWKWYSSLEVWDDQDLVRFCLHPKDSNETYARERVSAVFCDEAQDFTRTEIEFILKISSFSNRKYANDEEIISKLPFVFAGDEFQTLNPTGFSWDSLKSYFTERLSDLLNIDKPSLKDPIQLIKNYRSTSQIVKLGNRIQLLRETRFQQKSLPQEPNFSEEGNSIFCLPHTDAKVWTRLKNMDFVLIVPSDDGQTPKDYIENSELKDMISFYDNGAAKNLTILNPLQAKGLEYPNVAIYGFNCTGLNKNFSLDELCNWYENDDKIENENENDIDLKYQINNAYVAVTRAKKNLVLLDNFDETSFWAFAFSASTSLKEKLEPQISRLEREMFAKLGSERKEIWTSDKLGWILEGNISEISSEKIQNVRENIMMIKNRGMELQEPSLLRQAAARFKERDYKQDYYECLAYAECYDRNYYGAAEYFEKAEVYDMAVRNYWSTLEFRHNDSTYNKEIKDEDIIRKIAQLTSHVDNYIVSICTMITKKEKPRLSELNILLDRVLNDSSFICKHAWELAVNKLLKEILENNTIEEREYSTLLKLSDALKAKFEIDKGIIVLIGYKIQKFYDVIDICEHNNLTLPEYYKSKVKVCSYPEKLRYFEGTKDIDWKLNVLKEYQAYRNYSNLEQVYKIIIGRCVFDLKDQNLITIFLPIMLAQAQSRTDSDNFIKIAKLVDLNINVDVLMSLVDARYTNSRDWKFPRVKYSAPEAAQLYEILHNVKELSQREDNFKRSLKYAKNTKNFLDDRFGRFSRNPFLSLLLFQLGTLMEKAGIFIDAIRFYEWAKNQSDDPALKRQMDIRWIACKERQGENDQNESYINEAKNKRNVLGLSEDEKIALYPEINKICSWETLFQTGCKINNDVVSKIEKQSREAVKEPVQEQVKEPVKETEAATANVVETAPTDTKEAEKPSVAGEVSSNLQTVCSCGYEFCFNPAKKVLSIRFKSREDDYMIKIRNGKFPADQDFVLDKDNRMIIDDTNEATPFKVVIDSDFITLELMDGDICTGAVLRFRI